MFFASAHHAVANLSVTSHVALGRAWTVHVVARKNLVYDARFVPPARGTSGARPVRYFLLQGELNQETPTQGTWKGPCQWNLTEDIFEGAHGVRDCLFQLRGKEFLAVAVYSRLLVPPSEPLPFVSEITPALQTALERYAKSAHDSLQREQWHAACGALARSLVEAGVAQPQLVESVPAPHSLAARAGNAMSILWERLETSASLDGLADKMGFSRRHAYRALEAWLREVDFHHETWRDLTQRWRTKLAVLLLSSPEVSVSDVAKIVGYGRVQALSNAFHAAGLPPPTRLREAVLASVASQTHTKS